MLAFAGVLLLVPILGMEIFHSSPTLRESVEQTFGVIGVCQVFTDHINFAIIIIFVCFATEFLTLDLLCFLVTVL